MRKIEKFTQVYFNEAEPQMEITTYNTNLKHRLSEYAKQFPELCRITETDEGRMSFEIDKTRCTLRLTKPYSEERKQAIRETAKERGIHTHRKQREGDANG